MQVQEDVALVLKDFHAAGKVIGMTCIAPLLAAKVLGDKKLKITLGKHGENFPFSGTIDLASSFGNKLEELDINDVCVDW
jgi:enhancing lycopene biosynthesis protein 2